MKRKGKAICKSLCALAVKFLKFMETTCLMAIYSPCTVIVELTNALGTKIACCSLWVVNVMKALNRVFHVRFVVGNKVKFKKGL